MRRQFGLADVPPFAIEVPPDSRAGRPRRAGRLPARADAAEGAARDRAGAGAARSARSPGVARVVAAPNGYLNLYLDRAGVPARPRCAGEVPRRPAAAEQDHRRAHGDQPEQGGAHRPPAQRGARRHAGPRAALPRHARRSAELHRRHRRPGRRRRRRLPRARAPDARRGAARSPTRRGSTTTAGICTRGSPSGTTATRRASPIRAAALHDLEHGGNDTAAIGAFIADRIVRATWRRWRG